MRSIARRPEEDFTLGGGYVFSAIHNILAEIDPRKVVAMYRVAAGAKSPPP
jgi:hypothetical protein